MYFTTSSQLVIYHKLEFAYILGFCCIEHTKMYLLYHWTHRLPILLTNTDILPQA